MPEKEKATVGKTVAGTALSANGNVAHPHDSTNGGEMHPTNLSGQMLGELQSLLEQAKVEPADILSAKKVAALLPQVATYQGLALQAAFDSLRILIGYLPTDEREALYPAFVEHKLFVKHTDWEQYLATCPEPLGSPRSVSYTHLTLPTSDLV